jgi:hypothetical protein
MEDLILRQAVAKALHGAGRAAIDNFEHPLVGCEARIVVCFT